MTITLISRNALSVEHTPTNAALTESLLPVRTADREATWKNGLSKIRE